MALIICPECGKKFSEFAKCCPNCQCPVDICKELLTQNGNDALSKNNGSNSMVADDTTTIPQMPSVSHFPPQTYAAPLNTNQYSNNRGFFQKPLNIVFILCGLAIIGGIVAGAIYYNNKVMEADYSRIEQMVRDSLAKAKAESLAKDSLENAKKSSAKDSDKSSRHSSRHSDKSESKKSESHKSRSQYRTYSSGFYTSIGKNLRVRLGPGFDYSFVTATYNGKPVHLQRGDQVYSDGQYANGFLHVYEGGYDSGYWMQSEGWVSTDYLR